MSLNYESPATPAAPPRWIHEEQRIRVLLGAIVRNEAGTTTPWPAEWAEELSHLFGRSARRLEDRAREARSGLTNLGG